MYDVILCTYNGAKYLSEQIDSILEQTVPFEHIYILDDGSTDETILLIKEKYKLDNLSIIINPVNMGYAKNFQNGYKNYVKSKYFALCDQDDIWHPQKAEYMLDALEVTNADLCYSDAQLIDEEGKPLGIKLSDLGKLGNTNTFDRKLCKDFPVTGATVFLRNDFIRKVPNIPAYVPHDAWLSVTASLIGNINYVDQCLIGYRQHALNQIGVSFEKRKKKLLLKNVEIRLSIYMALLASDLPLSIKQRSFIKDNIVFIHEKIRIYKGETKFITLFKMLKSYFIYDNGIRGLVRDLLAK
ncbi:glycosyltransferase family 2 protein [Vibrio splendidus]|uniref:glycosyltransferase family 2 protein n=1 Tax=Vibrio splendidus TaxID=29497 RepID=UPI000066F2EC|nr:glycosyltransferase family 2 protein [Vibrio splendidus]EAP95080.1 putative glycosyltransferase [Vibrio splendidus 12B01]